jgi:hypothetical protein
MISFAFTVRPGQGDPSGFDLGDITCTGAQGSASSAGHVPDQGMMIYVAVADLVSGVHALLEGGRKRFDFVGTDSSFSLTFRKGNKSVSVAAANGVIARTTEAELARALLTATEELERTGLSAVPDADPAKRDAATALAQLRELAP